MKKIILTCVCVLSVVSCNKNGTVSEMNFPDSAQISESIANLDSTITSMDDLPKLTKEQTDDALATLKGTAALKIEELNDEKELLTKEVAKELDSVTRTAIVSEIKLAQKKIDSVKSSVVSTVNKKSAAPKIIRETKVVYKESPRVERVEVAPRIVKDGQLEILVEDLVEAEETAKQQIAKYDGIIKTEKISSYDNDEYTYLKVSVPLEKSEYLIQDLENYVGKIVSRNVEITNQDFATNSICNLEITLLNDRADASTAATPTTFGGKTLGAVGSGWNVIQEIFLFILPFWPVFLIGGGIYFFVKKKKTEKI